MPMNATKNRGIFMHAFVEVCGACAIQDGWPCRSCFWETMRDLGLNREEVHALWLIQLKLRADDSFVRPAMYRVRVRSTKAGKAHYERIKKYQTCIPVETT